MNRSLHARSSAILSVAVLPALTLAACSDEDETATITVIASLDESLVRVQTSNVTIPDGQDIQIRGDQRLRCRDESSFYGRQSFLD